MTTEVKTIDHDIPALLFKTLHKVNVEGKVVVVHRGRYNN